MQSVYKFPIGMAVLHRVDQGTLSLDQKLHVAPGDLVPGGVHSPLRDKHPQGNIDVSVSELLRLTISESDGAASDVLMRAAGGARSVTQYLRSIGAKDIVVATTESAMAAGPMVQYRNWVTPVAAVGLLKLLQQGRGLSPRSRTLLLDWMTGSSPGPPSSASGPAPAINTSRTRMAISSTAGAATTCSRSPASMYRRSRSRPRCKPTPMFWRPPLWLGRTATG